MKTSHLLFITLLMAFIAASCVQMPTERASVVDTRPQISFRVTGDVGFMHVFIDGLDMGAVANYLDAGPEGDSHALRILPGSHVLKIMNNGTLIHEEKLYVGDGVSKTILVP